MRWYELQLDSNGTPRLLQQGTYAPDGGYRWMPSIAMDRKGDIGVGIRSAMRPASPASSLCLCASQAIRRTDDAA